MFNCHSHCSGIIRPYHQIGVNELGQYQCVECEALLNKSAIEKNLKIRFGPNWRHHYWKLNRFRRVVVKGLKRLQKDGFKLSETIYFETLENLVEHRHCQEKILKLVAAVDNPSERFVVKIYVLRNHNSHLRN